MIPVAAYVRMSTSAQRYSIENQLAAIEAFCLGKGMHLMRTYTDIGRSGVAIDNRPGLRGLVDAAQAGGLPFRNVIVFDVSRWGRFADSDEGAYYEHILRLAGAPVLYCAEAFENDDSPVSLIVKSFKRAMAGEYSRDLSVRTLRNQRRVAAQGFRLGGMAGYGYRRALVQGDGSLVSLDQGEWATREGRITLVLGPAAEVAAVRRIFRLFLKDGHWCRRIARMMTAEGRPAPLGKGWCEKRVRGILLSEKYAGVAGYGRQRHRAGEKAGMNPATDHIFVRDAYPAIVSMRTFRAAQARWKEESRPYRREDVIAPLQKLFAREGRVTLRLVAADPALPARNTIGRLFGSLERAERAAGLPVQSYQEKRALGAGRKGHPPLGSPQ